MLRPLADSVRLDLSRFRPRASRACNLGVASPWTALCNRRSRSILDVAVPPHGVSWVRVRDAGVLLLAGVLGACGSHRLQTGAPGADPVPVTVEAERFGLGTRLRHPLSPALVVGVDVTALPSARWEPVWAWPLMTPSTVPTSGFGLRWGRLHEGVDLAAGLGDVVLAVAAAVVVQAGARGTLGLSVELDHGDGWTTRYGHLSTLEVVEGDRVRVGEVLGLAGATGRATGPHLHLEVRREGVAVDPCHGLRTSTGASACGPQQTTIASTAPSCTSPISPPEGKAAVCVQ